MIRGLTLVCLDNHTHPFPGGVKVQSVEQLKALFLILDSDLQHVVMTTMKHNAVPSNKQIKALALQN